MFKKGEKRLKEVAVVSRPLLPPWPHPIVPVIAAPFVVSLLLIKYLLFFLLSEC